MKLVHVMLVDDHEVVRLGLKTLLEDVPWIKVVAEAGTAEEALQAVPVYRPDIVVMDIRLPGESGITACQQITSRWPEIKVIMLTSYGHDELVSEALQAGASGYVLKQIGNQELVHAIDAARHGHALLDPLVTGHVIDRLREREREHRQLAFKGLSIREMEVLRLVAQGKSNTEIAEKLFLSQKTVSHHVSSILAKLGLSNRIEAATYAVRNHLDEFIDNDQRPS